MNNQQLININQLIIKHHRQSSIIYIPGRLGKGGSRCFSSEEFLLKMHGYGVRRPSESTGGTAERYLKMEEWLADGNFDRETDDLGILGAIFGRRVCWSVGGG
jgi:hypothetical protein